MDHIRLFDWCSNESHSQYFVTVEDLDNSVTKKILQNTFHDPLISSDSEEETDKPKFDWNEIFKKKINDKRQRKYVAGLRPLPPFPKLSSLTVQQHYQCLKVLCSEHPNILETEFIPPPTKQDHKVFEEVKTIYLKEQGEFIEWAKTMWTNKHCIGALRPKPPIEMVYEAEFQMKAHQMRTFSKVFELAAQIPLETRNNKFEIVHQNDLINVDVTTLPQIKLPEMIMKRFTIAKYYTVPKPCNKHPCRFILPNENSMTILPITEVHRELAQYALDNDTQYIASENALKCLVEHDRYWSIPLSVCEVIGVDGDKHNVVVMGSEFSNHRDSAQTRTYRAFRHLLECSLIPLSERTKLLKRYLQSKVDNGDTFTEQSDDNMRDADIDSDDEEDNLFIDADMFETNPTECEDGQLKKSETKKPQNTEKENENNTENTNKQKGNIGFYTCTCQDTLYEAPPPRSFKKWQIKNNTTHENYDIVVHCPHKTRGEVGEVVLEPIPEYQIDLGVSTLSRDKIKSQALSLCLRRNASLLNVRVDGPTGDVVIYEKVYMNDLVKKHGDVLSEVGNTLHTALNQLQGLLPGHYILQHEPSHGANALLYVARSKPLSAEQLTLELDCSQLAEADEAKSVKQAPTLAPVLLPVHKFRKILPCAFTPNENQVVKEPKKSITKTKTPPQAIQWPKKRGKKKKKH